MSKTNRLYAYMLGLNYFYDLLDPTRFFMVQRLDFMAPDV